MPDIIMGLALMMILSVLIIPIAAPILDLMLVLSISMGVLVLILTTQIDDALHLSSFPSLLLILTLFRLSLNVATTRQILLRGYAGQVIQAFGDFVVGGNYVVGVVVFLVLVIINFMVITKGSGRIAEVAARFTLDAMPGKQMSIDADLNAGLIDDKQAIARREKLSRESEFYGAMDGASKFVRGDAVAGLIITAINIGGGFAIGMLQQDMSAANALRTYTILTVGDGLVAQVPALVISTAAGMLVTRAASDDTMGVDVAKQLFMRPRPLLMTGGILSIVSLVPGLPFLPFIVMGTSIAGMGFVAATKTSSKDAAAEEAATGKSGEGSEPGSAAGLPPTMNRQAPPLAPMEIEIGFGLVLLVDQKQGGRLIEKIGMVRKQIAEELGLILPPVNVRDNLSLRNTEYAIKVRGLTVASGSVRPGVLLAINPGSAEPLEDTISVREPVFGLDAYWIREDKREIAESRGMTVVDAASVITTHLAEESKKHAADILSRQDASDMVEQLKEAQPSVVDELMPSRMSIGGVHRVLQGLLRERVPVRDLALILETISDHVVRTQDTTVLVEFCRRALGGHICHARLSADGTLPAIGVAPDLDALVKEGIRDNGDQARSLVLEPSLAREVLNNIARSVSAVKSDAPGPVLLTSPVVRPYLRQMTAHEFSAVPVISFAEVPDAIQIDILGTVGAPDVSAGTEIMEEEAA